MAEFPHLPAAHEPGAQSRRNRAERGFWAPFVGLVGTAMFAAGVWVAAGGRGGQFDRQEELFGGLFFAACGLLCVYGGLAMWERGSPKEHPRLRGTKLLVGSEAIRRGDELSVILTGSPANVERLEVGLACDERYDVQTRTYVQGSSRVSRQTADATVHEEWQAVPAGGGDQTLTFRTPPEGPYSYEGDCVSYAWRVSARAVRTMRPDARLDQPIWVEP